MSLGQRLQQKLLQKLSPQQIQLMKLLQVPTAHLEERVKEELEENPALEAGEDGFNEPAADPVDDFENADDFENDGSEDDYGKIDISEYVSEGDDEPGDYKYRDDNYGDPDDKKVIPHKVEISFYDTLKSQLLMLHLNDHERKIAEQIIGSIDDEVPGLVRKHMTTDRKVAVHRRLQHRYRLIDAIEQVPEEFKSLREHDAVAGLIHTQAIW